MSTNYPTSLDSYTNPNATDVETSPPHHTQHTNENDAIVALETKLGADGSAVTTTVDYKAAHHQHTGSDGSATVFDSSTPAAIGTAAAGSNTVASRTNHVHATGAGTPTTAAYGDTAATGTGPAAAMTDHRHGLPFARTYDVRSYGTVDTTGATDSSTAILAAITAWEATGGDLYFPQGTIRVDSQIVLTNDGATQPNQKSGRWLGTGATFSGSVTTPVTAGGTILDLRYTGGGVGNPKVDTRGLGLLDIAGITFTDLGASSNPFIKTTNTTLHIHHCAFIGNPGKSGAACDQDCIILGGTNAPGPDNHGLAQAPFQGYGTVIESNYFNQIRRMVLGQTYCNGVVIANNVLWNLCGSTLANDAPIVFSPEATDSLAGNYVYGNLLELPAAYVYGVKAAHLNKSFFGPNNFFDVGANITGYYFFDTTATYNLVFDGMRDDSKALIVESGASIGTNSNFTAHQSKLSTFTSDVLASGGNGLLVGPVGGNALGRIQMDTAGEVFFRNASNVIKGKLLSDGTLWQYDGAGGNMTQDSGTGGSYLNLINYGVKFTDFNGGPLRAIIGAGTDGIKLGASSDAILSRAAAHVLASDGAFAPAGLTGATAATRYVGGTASGAPSSGTFAVGDFAIDQAGRTWVCTSAGSPGTWTQTGVDRSNGGKQKYTALGNSGATLTLDVANGNVQGVTNSASCTYTMPSALTSSVGISFTLIVTNNGAFTATFTGVKWAGASAPVLTSGAGKVDIFAFQTVDGGTTWYGNVVGQNMS